ncbi:RNI-like protein [Aureobasidium sp. EXF-12298]|nr:RNI-like protein [Aureobasidium sp. EXF-12298]
MESVHGVDVSWLHQPNRDRGALSNNANLVSTHTQAGAEHPEHEAHVHRAPGVVDDAPPPVSSHARSRSSSPVESKKAPPLPSKQPSPPRDTAPAQPPSSNSTDSPNSASKPSSRRPSILSRSGSQREGPDGTRSSRRNSWISNISSKFSSQAPPSPSVPQTTKSQANGTNAGPSSQSARDNLVTSPTQPTPNREAEELQPYVPQRPKDSNSSFFSNLTRRLSSGAQNAGNPRAGENGGVCPRRVLNVNQNRERCLLPELDSAKLRRVAFSVDVEIASGPRYREDGGDASSKQKNTNKKMKERGEGEALKHPQAETERKEQSDAAAASTNNPNAGTAGPPETSVENGDKAEGSGDNFDASLEDDARKKRKEEKRQKAENSGQLPRELDGDISPTQGPSANGTPIPSGAATPKDRPTTDPVRIYRRCCQLRESPILKRITEQLMAEDCTSPDDPGTVTQLNLTGSRLQLADFVTLSDWLAIVPVKRLLLEDADLSDEGLRVVLSGLLASKKPQPTRRRNGARQIPAKPTGGIVEKLTLKNNPRISRIGWKHISVFLYMCRSIKALDVSMLHFPQELPPVESDTNIKAPQQMPKTTGKSVDAAETLFKALSGRLGGSRLEEITMAECGLAPYQIRKLVDGATACGIARLGFAGNKLNDEGFEHILHYVRSGVCQALDLGSNDLRGKLGKLAEALKHNSNCPVWALGLANCSLDTNSLKELLPTLTTLRDFRFIDISHNRSLFVGEFSALQLLRKYLPKLENLKRLHLVDVGLSVKQAISLAEVLPEGVSLAHLTILENPQLSALSQATDEDSQEEACALYASLCAAARVSKSLVCIDVDVPGPGQSEVVKALAKQIVAYCLRNMDRTMAQSSLLPAATMLSKQHGVEDARQAPVPDVLVHLVGHVDGDRPSDGSDDETAPDDDYIVGGNGIIKALEYFLGQDKTESRHGSISLSGTTTPRDIGDPAQSENKRRGKAKEVSRNLLDSARKLRNRLKPALAKEFAAGDEMNYRRLLFLDQTLSGMIERFEDEFPETRLHLDIPPHQQNFSLSSSLESMESGPLSNDFMASSATTFGTETSAIESDLDEDEIHASGSGSMRRKASDVSLASRALAIEEGRIHRLGHKVRQDLIDVPVAVQTSESDAHAEWAPGSHMAEIASKMADLSGPELRVMVAHGGWEGVMEKMGANLEELQQLQMKDPQGWEQFKESQLITRANRGAPIFL